MGSGYYGPFGSNTQGYSWTGDNPGGAPFSQNAPPNYNPLNLPGIGPVTAPSVTMGTISDPAQTVNAGGYGNIDQGVLSAYSAMSPQEMAALSLTTDIAKQLQGEGQGLYNVGMPAYTQALNYAQQILGGNQAAAQRAVGPTEQNIADIYAGQKKAIEASGLRGGARDTAIAQAMQGQARDTGNLLPQMQTQMFQTAGQLGLAGAQAGGQFQQSAAGLNAEVAQLYQQQGQFAIQAEQANRFGIGQLNVANRGLDIQQALGNAAIDLQQQGINNQASQYQQSFAEQQRQFNQQFDWTKYYQQTLLQMQQQQLRQQQEAAQGNKWGQLLGSGLGVAAHFL